MAFVKNFIQNPVKVTVFVILMVMFGLIAIGRMPIQLIPDVEIPTLQVETRWPGASPEEIENEIVKEQEEQLKSVEGVVKMSSESQDSRGQITLEFVLGTDLDAAITTVNARLQQVREYPIDADKPVISTSNASDRPIAWFILNNRLPSESQLEDFEKRHPELADELARVRSAMTPGLALYRLRQIANQHPAANELVPPETQLTSLRRFAENTIESRFEKVTGVSQANVFGGQEDELQVVVNPEQLAARRLTLADVREALAEQNIDISAGDFWEGKRRWVVRTMGRFRDPKQVADTVIARESGRPIYVRDVADVRLGFKKPESLVRRFGTSVIAINVSRRTGTNVLEVMDELRVAMQELNDGMLKPRGLQLALVSDETEYITSAVNQVWDNIAEGAALTIIVLLLFLRSFRSTVVVFLCIAVSIIGMFLMMSLMGRTLNVPSLAGIAFAVGMLVDNFIVVLENAHRHRQMGKPPFQAAIDGASEVWSAIVTSTLANLAVFIPVLFVKDEAGQLFRDIALATASALVLSLLVALVVVPTASARILGESRLGFFKNKLRLWESNGHAGNRRGRAVGALRGAVGLLDQFGARFVTLVVRINSWLQARSYRLIATSIGFLVITVGLTVVLLLATQIEYLPTGNRNLVIARMLPPPGYNLDQMKEMGAQLEARLKPYWDIDPASPEAAELDYPPIEDFFYVARGRMLFMGMRAEDPTRASELVPLIKQVAGDLPDMMTMAFQSSLFERGLSAGRNIEMEITGPDIQRLTAIGRDVFEQLPDVFPELDPLTGRTQFQAMPVPSLELKSPELHVTAKRDQAEDQGMRNVELGYAVNALVDGAYATDYYVHGDKIDLSIVGDEEFASRTQHLERLPIATPLGGLSELAALANIEYRTGPEQINHRERERAVSIMVTPPPHVAMEEAIERIESQIIAPLAADGQINDGQYAINLSGAADKLRQAWDAMKWNLLLALVITYLVMAALFESWLYPFVIILSVPLGAVGGFMGLWLLNLVGGPLGITQSLDVLTMLGFIILIGTVVNNPILIVEQALNHIRDDDMPHRQAVVESVRTRIRPIFMTTLIGFFGLLPLVISPGAGAELYRGLGSVLLGGLLVSTVFTLFLVPSLFSLALELRDAIASRVSFWRPTERHELLALDVLNGERLPEVESLPAQTAVGDTP
jgi:HAE1 family hydrophobic/amphiphilic exporter-1